MHIPSQPLPARLRELRRVIPIAEGRSTGGAILTLLSLELYEDGSVLRGQLTSDRLAEMTAVDLSGPSTPMRPGSDQLRTGIEAMLANRWHPELRLRAWDDAGHRYVPLPMGGALGRDRVEEFSMTLGPSIPLAARVLTVEVPSIEWRRYGSGRSLTQPAESEVVQTPAWVFTIDLMSGRAARLDT